MPPETVRVTPLAIVTVVKLKTFEIVGCSGGVMAGGLNKMVPAVVRFSAPSAPVEPLLNVWA
jgi:hypothetical protein